MKSEYHNISILKLGILFFLFALTSGAELASQNLNQVGVQVNQLQLKKNTVVVDWNILLQGAEISSNKQLVLTPVIQSGTGQWLALPKVIINGKKRQRLYNRSLVLSGIDSEPDVYRVLRTDQKKTYLNIPYSISIPKESWMNGASVYLKEDDCGCGGAVSNQKQMLVGSLSVPNSAMLDFAYTPKVSFITPQAEVIKTRNEKGEAYLVFEVNESVIVPSLANNREELSKIDRSLNYIKEEPTAKISKISIIAYASPEGTYASNLSLSQRRANALKTYVQENYKISPSVIMAAEGKGEAWDALLELVKQDTKIEAKQEVLNIIQTVDIFAGRETQLMNLAGGRPYNYMLENLFPKLRRSDYQIEYTVPSFTLEKGIQLIDTKPTMLSLAEMYAIADTHSRNSEEFKQTIRLAQKIYPEDRVARLNAAALALLEHNEDLAADLLAGCTQDVRAWNSIGVMYMGKHQFEIAETYLRQALNQGDPNASENLLILVKLKEAVAKYEQSQAEYEEYNND